jgi:hypothetical protein
MKSRAGLGVEEARGRGREGGVRFGHVSRRARPGALQLGTASESDGDRAASITSRCRRAPSRAPIGRALLLCLKAGGAALTDTTPFPPRTQSTPTPIGWRALRTSAAEALHAEPLMRLEAGFLHSPCAAQGVLPGAAGRTWTYNWALIGPRADSSCRRRCDNAKWRLRAAETRSWGRKVHLHWH